MQKTIDSFADDLKKLLDEETDHSKVTYDNQLFQDFAREFEQRYYLYDITHFAMYFFEFVSDVYPRFFQCGDV